MMEGLQISIPQRMMMVRLTIIFSLVLSMILSFNLWGGIRLFPLTPLIRTDQLKQPFDVVYPLVAILSWIASTILRKGRLFLFFSFLICLWLVLNDVQRLQPWFYVYNALLLIFIFYNGRVDDPNKYTSYFILLQIIVASVYFFNGLSQLNPDFVEHEFIGIISPLKEYVSERQFALFVKLGHVIPYIMIFIGAGLIISPIRYLAITLALVIHFFLLIFFFPSQKNLNYALWLSNFSFMIFVLLLFSGKTKQRYFSPTFLFQMPSFYLVMILFVIMPFFNRRDQWPDFMSSNFRSANNQVVKITVSPRVFDNLPQYEKHFYSFKETSYELDYRGWCLEELNADCYPDKKVFNSIYKYLEGFKMPGVKEIELEYLASPAVLRKP